MKKRNLFSGIAVAATLVAATWYGRPTQAN